MTKNNINIMGGFSDRGVSSPLLGLHPLSIPKELYKHMVLCIAKSQWCCNEFDCVTTSRWENEWQPSFINEDIA
jgi:hypothetical protein